MTDHDRAASRREIADALLTALERRHEVLDVIVEARDRNTAVDAIATLLGTSRIGSEAVMGMSFDQLTIDSRRRIAKELDDLNGKLSFTLKERPASSDESLQLRPFSHEIDRDIFGVRTTEVGAAGDGSGSPAAAWTTRSVWPANVSARKKQRGSSRSTATTKWAWSSVNSSAAR